MISAGWNFFFFCLYLHIIIDNNEGESRSFYIETHKEEKESGIARKALKSLEKTGFRTRPVSALISGI
jgi:hypothetical protein